MTEARPDLKPLAGRVAIVTGAGRGAGEAIAYGLGAAGARVCAADLNPDRAERVAEAILAAGGEAFGWQADVSSKFQVAGLIETTRDRYGRLDVLVQHAHVSPRGDALKLDEWDLRRTVEVNVVGAFLCAQLAARVMADEGGGLIALMMEPPESIAAGAAVYAATQVAVGGLARALAAELGGRGVRVEAVVAGDADEVARRVVALCEEGFSGALPPNPRQG